MASFIISTQPAALSAVPGENSTFTVAVSTNYATLSSLDYVYQWYADDEAIDGATGSSYEIDPLIQDDGKVLFATVQVLSGATLPLSTVVTMLSSDEVELTVEEDSYPYDVFDKGSETGRQRHARLRNMGII